MLESLSTLRENTKASKEPSRILDPFPTHPSEGEGYLVPPPQAASERKQNSSPRRPSTGDRAPMAALLRTAAALAPPPSSPLPAREPRGRCLRLACSRRAPARPLRAWLLPTPHVFCRDGARFRRLAATEADEAAQTATQVRVGVLVAVARVTSVVPLCPMDGWLLQL